MMKWIAASVIFLGAVVWYVKTTVAAADRRARKSRAATGKPEAVPAPESKAVPAAEPQEKPAASEKSMEDILVSGNMEAMQEALSRTTDAWQRHRLYTALVQQAYKNREQTTDRFTVLTYGRRYVDEFEQIVPVLRKKSERAAREAPIFKMMAITLEENQNFDEAIDICAKALQWDLDDGTKTGYRGRMDRIRRKQS